jgi:exosortase A-associated hydrolase 1
MSHALRESVLSFGCGGEPLLGILAEGQAAAGAQDLAVIIIVGGPQYRAGSHRQFVLLARHLAMAGIPALRFDYRGMGDAAGEARDFLNVDEDIRAAIDALQAGHPAIRRVVLWGLCDAASAALLYQDGMRDARVAGLVLANPWVRSVASLARAQVKHYYWQRLREPAFWRKLLGGGVGLRALRDLGRNVRLSRGSKTASDAPLSFQDRMARGLKGFKGPVLLVLSGADITAQEFLEQATSSPAWQGLLARPGLQRLDLPTADHTFSSTPDADAVNAGTTRWIMQTLSSS